MIVVLYHHQAMDLPGAAVVYTPSLHSLLGEGPDDYERQKSALAAQRTEMLARGKSERDVDKTLQDAFDANSKRRSLAFKKHYILNCVTVAQQTTRL